MPQRINLTPTRHHRAKSHYGTVDYYNYFKHNNPELKISDSIYRKILRGINSEIRNKIASIPYDFKIPKRLGYIKVRKYYPQFIVDSNGVFKNKMGVDFSATLKLWEEDPSARKERIFIYYENTHSDGFIFKIKYEKRTAKYKNKSVYMFNPNREMKTILSRNISNKNLDAFLL